MSNLQASSLMDCAATTFSDVPVSTASDATVMASSPDSRRLAIESAPVRFDSASPVDVVSTSEVSVSVTVDDRRRLPAIVEALSEFAEVACEPDMAIVCAVGEGLKHEPRLVARVFEALGDVPVRLLSQAASRRNITFVIPEADVPKALGRLHEHFFATAGAGAGA